MAGGPTRRWWRAVHTCGLATGGTAYCWGGNDHGQLGDGTSGTDRLVPVAVSRRI
ncbi:MAG: hypothetical protein EBQ56_01865 [Proteobacteria bacterium]|nr:hypothetical protein [Pseudomonadota bacterium]